MGQLVKRPQKPQHKILTTSLVDGKGQNTTTSFLPFIQSNGGDYFFSPSLSLLREMGGLSQPGNCKPSDSCCCGPSIAYRGKFNHSTPDGTPWASNENIWAIFPKGQADGAPLYVLTAFTKNNVGTEKKPFYFHYKAIHVDSGSRAFTTKGDDFDGTGYYDFFDRFDGTWSEDGQMLQLIMRDQSEEEIGRYPMVRW